MKSRPSSAIGIVELRRVFWIVTNLESIAAMEILLILQTKINKLSRVDFSVNRVRNDNVVMADRAVTLSARGELARKDGSRDCGPAIFASKVQPSLIQRSGTRRKVALGHIDSIAQGQFSVYATGDRTH